MEPLRTPSPPSPRPSLPLLLSATASASAARSSGEEGAGARSRGTGRRAAAGGTFDGGSAASAGTGFGLVGHTANGLAGGAQGTPREPGCAVDGGAQGPGAAAVHMVQPEEQIENGSENPYLTDKNKEDRLKWCLSMLDPSSVPHDPMFQGLFDYVFIEKKWHYITRKSERDNTVPRVLILTAVARPRFDSLGFCTFDGKIGCFPFVTYGTAKRSSAKRPAGTIEMKATNSVNEDDIRSFMIEKVLPAIRANWPPQDASKPIFIQQDNAIPYLSPDDRMFCEAAKQHGFDMRLVCQPENSPDFNVLNLGFFNTFQSVQYKKALKTTEELVAAVEQAFERYSVRHANRIFLTLQGCMNEAMKLGGGNEYDAAHIRKMMLERQGRPPPLCN